MDVKAQLERLLRIQELSLAIREAEAVVEGAPSRIEEIEERFRNRNAEYVGVKTQHDEVEHDQKTRSAEMSTLEAQLEKYKAAMLEVKNQREYSAMLKEIDTVKAEISGHEEAILKDMEALESLKVELAKHEEHIQQEREIVGKETAGVRTAADSARKTIEELRGKRVEAEEGLPSPLLSRVGTLEANRQGVFLSKADNGVCQSCFVRVRPQAFQEVRAATAIHTCSNCRRFLYYEPALRPAPAESTESADGGTTASSSAGSDMGAANGGAV